jgi:uncharacterized protein (DUF2384 family)
MPVETRSRVRALVEDLGGRAEVARALGVHRSRVTRWLEDEDPDPANTSKVEAFEFVLARLLKVYPRNTALKWLTGYNANLGDRRPVDMLSAGRVSEVIGAIDAEDAGSFA